MMYKGFKLSGKLESTHLVVALCAGIFVIIVALAVTLLPNSQKSSNKGDVAFGMLPSLQSEAMDTSLRAMGMPVDEAEDAQFLMPEMEYTWTGGGFPKFDDKLMVYRRHIGKISIAEAKKLAAAFGITGDPETEELSRIIMEDLAENPPQESFLVDSPGETKPAQPGQEKADINPAPDHKIYRFFDEKEGKRLEIYEADLRFYYSIDRGYELAEKSTEQPPSEAEAKKIAKKFLEDRGLLPEGATEPFAWEGVIAAPDDVVSSDESRDLVVERRPGRSIYIEVQFGKKLGNYDLVEPSGELSRYVAVVTVGPGGKILGAHGELPSGLESSMYPLTSVSDAFEEVKKGAYAPIRILGIPVDARSEELAGSSVGAVEPEFTSGAGESSGGGVMPGNSGVDELTITPEPKKPPVKPPVIKIEVNKVKLGYMPVFGPDGIGFYLPAFVFSGVMIEPEGQRSDYSVAVPAVASKYIDNN